MSARLSDYAAVAGGDVIDQLRQLAKPLAGKLILHVNSTRQGGGVAEILNRLIPLMRELGIDARWEVISGPPEFYQCTKMFHNALQGLTSDVSPRLLDIYKETNRENAARLRPLLEESEIVFVHDPQPAALLDFTPKKSGKWIWRCHIDVSTPYRPVWKFLRGIVSAYDASIWSLATFAQPLEHLQYLVPPSIDPLSEKNVNIDEVEISAVCQSFGIDRSRPLIVQVSRFDRFKDPLGVIHAFRIARRYVPHLQLVLAGSGAADDPEGEAVLNEVRAAAEGERDVFILMLPSDAHRTINALQRAADIVLQKSVREGFGLTVTEAMWKGRPVIGGNTGGIRLQVVNHHTGFLVSSPEGAALRIRYLLGNSDLREAMGRKARALVRDSFLITRHLRDYLTMILGISRNFSPYIELT